MLEQDWVAWFMSWAGAAFDLSIVFLLLWKRTRLLGLGMAIFFHLTNHLVFNIGIFPYLSLALTGLFFPPAWPRRWLDHLAEKYPRRLGRIRVNWQQAFIGREVASAPIWQQTRTRLVFFLLAGIMTIHFLLPLRHHLYPGDVAWTEEGHRYAWRMMLRTKSGRGHFEVKDLATGESEKVFPTRIMRRKQSRKLFTHPDMILQYAHHLRTRPQRKGGR